MKFNEIRRAGWDTETTGTSVREDRIVTAAFIVRTPGSDDRVFSWLINPGVPIPPETTEVHGIDDVRAQADGVEPAGALDEIASHLTLALRRDMPLVAFNQSFDWSVLHYELARHGLPSMADRLHGDPVTLIDPHVLDKQFDRYVKGKGMRKLESTAGRYGVEIANWHEAEADAHAALGIAEVQFERYGHLNTIAPAQLYALQRGWRKQQQEGLQAHFRKTDPDAVCETGWPLIVAGVSA